MNNEVRELHTAIRVLDKNKITAAVKNGVFLQLTENEKVNLLIYSIRKGCIETTSVLIENGADAFSSDEVEIISPIGEAFKFGYGYRDQPQHAFLEKVLTVIPDIFATDMDGNNLIHYACIYNRADKLQYLVDRGVDINGVNHGLETPLHLASYYNNWLS